jgi:hypothetical protein
MLQNIVLKAERSNRTAVSSRGWLDVYVRSLPSPPLFPRHPAGSSHLQAVCLDSTAVFSVLPHGHNSPSRPALEMRLSLQEYAEYYWLHNSSVRCKRRFRSACFVLFSIFALSCAEKRQDRDLKMGRVRSGSAVPTTFRKGICVFFFRFLFFVYYKA